MKRSTNLDLVTHVICKWIRAENVSLRVTCNNDIAITSVDNSLASLQKKKKVSEAEEEID
jgi:hypothetical protein